MLGALQKRLPGLTRPFWEDEVHHNYQILEATSLRDMRWTIQSQLQPLLDYVLRRVVWFNLFGFQELHLRLPSLIASLAMVAGIFLLSTFYLHRTTRMRLAPALVALSLASWAVAHPSDVHYAAEARHYSLVSLVSVLWVVAFLLAERYSNAVLVVASAVFMNVHFFAIPLVGAALVTKALLGEERGRVVAVLRAAGIALALTVATAFVNRPAFTWLVLAPPGATASSPGDGLRLAVAGGLDLFKEYCSYLALPVPFLVLAAALLGLLLVRIETRRAAGLLVLVGILLPALFVTFRLRSQYSFGPRYFTPFFGVGFGMLLVLAAGLVQLTDRITKARGRWAQRAGSLMVAVVALLACHVPAAAGDLVRDWPHLRRPPENFSPYFQIYQELRASRRPLFVLHSHPWSDDIPLLYLQFVGGEPYPFGYQVADSMGTLTTPFALRTRLIEFLTVNPNGMVVLDAKEKTCEQLSVAGPRDGVVVTRIQALPVCVWTISGASSIDDLRAVARSVGFESVQGIL